ncbi:MAG: hypothetical protein RLZZ473_424 [Pseudomonadota bacterium]|jgi:hypothetical protein
MTTEFPDRLSVNPRSPHYDATLLERSIGIRLSGVEYTNVEEYCISEGWIRVALGKTLDRKGQPLTVQRKGTVEPFFKD